MIKKIIYTFCLTTILIFFAIYYCVVTTEKQNIYPDQPIIYTKKTQYVELYQQNAQLLNSIILKLCKYKVNYSISLIDFNGKKGSIAVHDEKFEESLNTILQDHELLEYLTILNKNLKINYIIYRLNDKGNYIFSRTNALDNNLMGLQYAMENEYDSKRYIDKNWNYFYSIDTNNYPIQRRFYDFIYNNTY